LTTGSVILIGQPVQGKIRASQLGKMSLRFFRVKLDLLTGIATLGEQHFFESAARRQELSLHILPPEHSVAIRFKDLCNHRRTHSLAFRLALLRLFVEVFGERCEEQIGHSAQPPEARERLVEILRRTTASELLSLSFTDFVRMMNCTPRHVSRIFNEVVGMSFREKQTRLRLARACELLATTEMKIITVALESGYQSLSLFSLIFRKRFGMSPGQWRREQGKNGKPQNSNGQPLRRWPTQKTPATGVAHLLTGTGTQIFSETRSC